jgi:hypothetical protein
MNHLRKIILPTGPMGRWNMNDERETTPKIDIGEFKELINIPEVGQFMSQAFREAKEKFKDQVNRYLEKSKTELEQKVSDPSSLQENWEITKSYPFELKRVENPQADGSYKWAPEDFKFKERTDFVESIFRELLKKIDDYESNPQKSHRLFFMVPYERPFEIRFIKYTDDNVTGFVKELEKDKEEYVTKEKGTIRIAAKYPHLGKEELYKKIIQLMEENEGARKHFFLYYLMVEKVKNLVSPGILKS